MSKQGKITRIGNGIRIELGNDKNKFNDIANGLVSAVCSVCREFNIKPYELDSLKVGHFRVLYEELKKEAEEIKKNNRK